MKTKNLEPREITHGRPKAGKSADRPRSNLSDRANTTIQRLRDEGRTVFGTRNRAESSYLAGKLAAQGIPSVIVDRRGNRIGSVGLQGGTGPIDAYAMKLGYSRGGRISYAPATRRGTGAVAASGSAAAAPTNNERRVPSYTPLGMTYGEPITEFEVNHMIDGVLSTEVISGNGGVGYTGLPDVVTNIVNNPSPWIIRPDSQVNVGDWSEAFGEEGFLGISVSSVEGVRQYIEAVGYTWSLGATPLQRQFDQQIDALMNPPATTSDGIEVLDPLGFRNHGVELEPNVRGLSRTPQSALPPATIIDTIPLSVWD